MDDFISEYKAAYYALLGENGVEIDVEKRGSWYVLRKKTQFAPAFKYRRKQIEAMTEELRRRLDQPNERG